MTATTASPDVWSTPLTPLAFLGRSAEVFPDREAVVYGERRMTYTQLSAEVTRVAHALRACGVTPGDRVAYLMPNIPEMLVANFAVPLAGGVLVAINTRLAPPEVKYILEHSGATVLVVDAALHNLVDSGLGDLPELRHVVTVTDPAGGVQPSPTVPGFSYDQLLAMGNDESLPWTVEDERSTISINYTSGTTGRPKGVMYHHRGAFLNSLSEIIHSQHTGRTRYLWTLPMFHCNGWCTAWAITAIGGTHVCLRAVDADVIWDLFDKEGVTHLNGSPTVLVSIASSSRVHTLDREIVVTVAGAPPSPTVISTMTGIGAKLVHVYGLTETYGPYTVCEVQVGWDALDIRERSRLMARQGVGMIVTDGIRVVDDYAHNGEKIRAAITAAQSGCDRLIAIFQPHGYGPARFLRPELREILPTVLRAQDRFCYAEIFYSGGTVAKDISSRDLAADLPPGLRCGYAANHQQVLAWAAEEAHAGDTVLLMGARDPDLPKLAHALFGLM